MMEKLTYKKSGVDVTQAEKFIKGIRNIFPRSNPDKILAFGSVFSLKDSLKKYRDPVLVSSTDGVGTKLMLAQKFNAHRNVGVDLVAMNVNDVICLGAKPLFFLDYVACGKLKHNILQKVMFGIRDALEESGCVLLGGETAEMPGMYKPSEYDLAGFCVGIVDQGKIVSGKNINVGDIVIGIESSGLHSNGFSLARKALKDKGVKQYKRQLLIPTRLYVKPILSLLSDRGSSLGVRGIAHVTGGAFYNKATKILPKGLGMLVEKKSWRLPEIFTVIQKKGNLDEREMYSVFNMGIGMVVVVSGKYAKKALAILNKQTNAHFIGRIIKSSKKMNLID